MPETLTAADYEAVIGLEVHCQLKTNTKMFCGCKNEFGGATNSHTCPVCLGLPGVLPVPNAEAIVKTLLTGEMLGCQIATRCKFDRKNYFYPDMPKNYQISQYDEPLCAGRARDARPARLPEGRAEGSDDGGGQADPARAHSPRGGRGEVVPLRRRHQRHRLQPRRHTADGNRQRGRHGVAGRGVRVSLRAEADPRLWRRERRGHGEGPDALRREHFRAAEGPGRVRHEVRAEESQLHFRRAPRAEVRNRAADRRGHFRRQDRAGDRAAGTTTRARRR